MPASTLVPVDAPEVIANTTVSVHAFVPMTGVKDKVTLFAPRNARYAWPLTSFDLNVFRIVTSYPSSASYSDLAEDPMELIQRSGRPWARRLLRLHADERLNRELLQVFVNVLSTGDREMWPTPGVFPGEDSGLRLEWTEEHAHTIFEIEGDGSMYAYFFDYSGDGDVSSEPRSEPEAISFLREHVNV